MDAAAYEKVVIADPDFPVWVLENDKTSHSRQQLCPLHWHEHLELHYILEGTLEIWINQTQYSLHRGDLLVINPNEPHSSYFRERLRERIFIFRLEELSKPLSTRVDAFLRIISYDSHIQQLLSAFEVEYSAQNLGWEAACMALLLQLTVHLARHYPLSVDSNQEYRRQAQLLRRLQPVVEHIALHYAEPISVQDLAGMVYVSTDRFHHLFKECMGIPLRKYINDIRLHTAYGWLEKGLCTPAEAASQAGFTDYNHFGRQFRQTFGCTPSQILHKTAK